MRVILTLPAYNEERSLPGLLEDFRSTARTVAATLRLMLRLRWRRFD